MNIFGMIVVMTMTADVLFNYHYYRSYRRKSESTRDLVEPAAPPPRRWNFVAWLFVKNGIAVLAFSAGILVANFIKGSAIPYGASDSFWGSSFTYSNAHEAFGIALLLPGLIAIALATLLHKYYSMPRDINFPLFLMMALIYIFCYSWILALWLLKV